jgi:hypothetical protein
MFGTEMPQLDCHNQYARTLIWLQFWYWRKR